MTDHHKEIMKCIKWLVKNFQIKLTVALLHTANGS